MSIAVVAGTTAELIKLAPVLRGITERGASYDLWNTAQHVGDYSSTIADLDWHRPTFISYPSTASDSSSSHRCPDG